jgi:hypothetical protein
VTTSTYLLGWLWLAAVVAPLLWGGGRLRARFAPDFGGASAVLADFVITLAALLLVCEIMGTAGLFRKLPVVALSSICGIACGLAAGGRPARSPARLPWRRSSAEAVAAAVAVACVAVGQIPPTVEALRGGISNFDSLEYHLTKPARWLQDASLNGVHQIYPGSLFPYYPSNSELVHGVGMLAFSSDVLSPVVNLGFIALAFLAAWTIGETRGVGSATVAALGAVLAALHFAQGGGGTAANDLPQAAFLLAAVALSARARGGAAALLVIGLAGGLAVGTKPTAGLAAGCVVGGAVLSAANRGRATAAAGLGVALGGGFWYLRDLLWIGTPIPGTDVGPFHTPLAEQLRNTTFVDAVRANGDPLGILSGGLQRTLGPAWMILAALTVAGLLLSLGPSRRGWERAAGLAGVATLLVWPFTPFTFIVDFAVRYAVAGLALGVVLLAVAPRLAAARARWLIPCFFAAVAVVDLIRVDPFSRAYLGAAMAGGLIIVAAGLALLLSSRRHLQIAAGGLAIVAVLSSIPVAMAYDRNRYTEARYVYSGPAAAALKRLYQWARGINDVRIGVDGSEIQYPLYGARLTNYVQYIGVDRPDGGFGRIATCPQWRAAINAGRYRYVLTVPWGLESNSPPMPSPHGDWTASDAAAELALDAGDGIKVFRITDRLDPRTCR